MIAAAAVLAVLLLIAFLRIGVTVEYGAAPDGEQAGEGGAELAVTAHAGPVRFRVYPSEKGKKEKPGKKKEKAAEGVKKAGRLVELKKHLPAVNTLLSRLRRKLLIRELTIHFMAAGDDPAATALWFGGGNIGYGFLVPILENNFRIKKRDLRSTVDFEKTEPYIYVRARLSLAVWEAVYAAWALVRSMLHSSKTTSKIRKAV